MVFQPVGNRILVKRKAAKEKSEGGIIIPKVAQEKMSEGEVIQLGRGRVQEDGSIRPFDVKVGDLVLFQKHAGTDIKIEKEDFLMLQEDDIFGILRAHDASVCPHCGQALKKEESTAAQ